MQLNDLKPNGADVQSDVGVALNKTEKPNAVLFGVVVAAQGHQIVCVVVAARADCFYVTRIAWRCVANKAPQGPVFCPQLIVNLSFGIIHAMKLIMPNVRSSAKIGT